MDIGGYIFPYVLDLLYVTRLFAPVHKKKGPGVRVIKFLVAPFSSLSRFYPFILTVPFLPQMTIVLKDGMGLRMKSLIWGFTEKSDF